MQNNSETGNKVESGKQSDVWNLKLYVAGQTPKSLEAFANLKDICETHLKDNYIVNLEIMILC